MKTSTLEYIFNQLGYATDTWVATPKITRIGLSDDGKLYVQDSGELRSEFYADTTHDLILERLVNYTEDTATVLTVQAIRSIEEIDNVETLNIYSESQFVGEK